MCHQIKTLAINCNGQLSFCNSCNRYYLTFNNIYLEFSKTELKSFKTYLYQIEIEYWETKYDQMTIKRKIPIQTKQHNLSLMFNRQELDALKDLVTLTTKKTFNTLSVLDIDYTLFLN